VLAQSFLFFLAGFETTANTLSLLGYSLATNPEKQEKLLKEIDEVMKDKVSQAEIIILNKLIQVKNKCRLWYKELHPVINIANLVCLTELTCAS